jgi:hypothetical protein
MTTSEPDLPPYDPERILAAPFSERVRLACRTWANSSPNQPSVMALYWAKYFVLLIGGWAFWVSFNADYPGFTSPLEWAFTADAFKKAVVWSMFYELIGFGCGWGPMNARFKPMMGGIYHFARPGTIKLPLFRGAPLIGGDTRNWLDVGAYLVAELLLLSVLVSAEVRPEALFFCILAIPLLGILDKTLFLVARAEHYWVALTCLTFAYVAGEPSGGDLWISACKVVWGFIWFWAATSKLNHHFPHVIMFMMNNGPFFPKILKKRLFKDFPEDLRPSTFAVAMANFGSSTEYLIPILLLSSTNETLTILSLCLMVSFHGFIALNNPNGMPIEWNILMIYGGIYLFGFNIDASPLALFSMPALAAFVFFMMVCIPVFGNFVPSKVSFLMSMRYYAGNWMYNIWLFKKGESVEKLKKLKKNTGTVREQMAEFIPDPQALEIATNVSMLVSRFMHLQGRPLLEALPKAVDHIDNYDWYEGEVLGGSILGWNFGDGHLNGSQLLRAIQEQCGFEEGELRVVSVESQPLFGSKMHWQIFDAATGLVEEGDTAINELRSVQPWPTGQYREALERGQSGMD